MSGIRCPHCSRPLRAQWDLDLRGDVHETVEFCGCPDSRREAGICTYCDNPIDKPRSRYCGDEHRRRGQDEAQRRFRRSAKGQAAQKRANRKRRTKAERAKRRLYEREYRAQPEVRERRRRNRRRLAVQRPEQKREQHRRYKERHPDRVKAQQRAANRRRAQAKRDYMHRYATKYVGPGRAPTCRTCGDEIPFDGVGRPMLECAACDPKRWAAKRRRDERAARREQREAA